MKKALYLLILSFILSVAMLSTSLAQVDVTASGGTGSASYSTLKAAFDAINAGTHTGVITIGISGSPTEVATDTLKASGTGSASYTSIVITPTGGAARTISGAITAPLIDLSGADNVKIDGLNTGGNSLTIENTTSAATPSTIRFIGDATSDTVQNCTIKGAGTSTSLGTIFFSTGTTTGNDNNLISNNTITVSGANFPTNGIYSLGTSAAIDNSGITVTGNNIQDYFNAASVTVGINVGATGNSGWTITNNKLFQSANRIFTAGNIHNGINVGVGSGYTITGNTIGYANSGGTGTTNLLGNTTAVTGTYPSSYTVTTTNANTTRYIGISCAFTAGGTVSNIQGNTIGGIALYSSSGASTTNGILCGINVTSGNANIGTTSGNIIGATSGQSSLYAINSSGGGVVVGIYATSTNTVSIQNNMIGAIDAVGTSATLSGAFTGIDVAGAAGVFTISNNSIGNGTANNIRVGYTLSGGNLSNAGTITSTTGTTSPMVGIRHTATGSTVTISSDTLRGWQNGTTAGGALTGITSTGSVTSSATINNNALGTSSLGWVTYTFANTNATTALCINLTGSGGATTHSIQTNDFRGITFTVSGTMPFTFITLTGATAASDVATIAGNTWNNLSMATTGAITFISHNYALSSTGQCIINNNSIVTGFTRTLAGSVTITSTNSTSTTGSINNYTNNNFSNITVTGSSALLGFNNTDGGTGSTKTITGNKFNSWTGTTSTITVMNFGYWNGISRLSNDTVTNITGQSTIVGIALGSSSNAASLVNVASNIVTNLSSTGTGGSVTGISSANTSTVINIDSNTVNTLSSTGTASTVLGIAVTGATNTSVFLNAINTLSSTGATSPIVAGIQVSGTGTTVSVYSNTINSFTSSGTTSPVAQGIAVSGGTTVNVYKNKIYDIAESGAMSTTSPSITGLLLSGGTTVTAYNNIISDLRAPASGLTDAIRGIAVTSVTASTTYNLYYNTVYLKATSSGTNFGTTGIFHAGSAVATTATLNMRNNVVVNSSTKNGTGVIVAFRRNLAALNNYASTSNTNDFYAGTPSASNLIYNDGTNSDQTLSAFKTRVGATIDNYSVTENPTFRDSTTGSNSAYLHINTTTGTQLESGGASISGITDDFDGDTRNTPPDIGADEFAGVISDLTAPIITYTTLGNTGLTTNRTLTVTITDASGVPTSGTLMPRIYYKKGAGSYFSQAGTLSSGTATSGTWSFTINNSDMGGVVATDVISYYVIAQDVVGTPNLTSNPPAGLVATDVNTVSTPPTTPNTYTVITSFSGSYNVGTGQTYTTLTGAAGFFAGVNAATLTGSVTVNITSDITETGANALNQWVEEGGSNFTLTIQPSAASLRTLSGTAVATGTPMIDFNGSDRVIIDGRFGGSGQYLTFRNTNATAANAGPTIRFNNSAVSDTLRYCTIENNGTTAAQGSVTIGATGTNANICISNNDLRDATAGTVGVPANQVYSNNANNTPVCVSFNNIYNFTVSGILFTSVGNGALVQGNNIYQTAARSTTTTGVNIAAGSNHVVRANNFYQTTGTLTAAYTAISLTGSGNNQTVSNNSIGGTNSSRTGAALTVNASSSNLTGISLTVGTTTASKVDSNYFSNVAATNASTSNTVFGVTVLGGNVNIGSISRNTFGGAAVSGVASDTIQSNYDNGIIFISSATIVKIENNLISNVAYYRLAGDRTCGIYASSGIDTIRNNIVRNISGNETGTSFSFLPMGIALTAATSGNLIEGNQVFNITNSNTGSAATNTVGIEVTGSVTNTVVRGNLIYNINGTATGTGTNSPLCYGLYVSAGSATYLNNMIALGTSVSAEVRLFGIQDASTGTNKFYFNSVAISGAAPSGSNNTYAFNRTSTALDTLRDNIFENYRTGSPGIHFAIGNTSATNWGSNTSNYNNFTSIIPTSTTQWVGTAYTLANWQTNSTSDTNTVSGDPKFINTATNLHINTSVSGSVAYNAGKPVTGITTDYDGDTRNGSAPDIGADEFSYPVPQSFTLTSPSGAGQAVAGNLSWATSTNATSYNVYFDQNNPPTTLVSLHQAGTTFAYSGSAATTYYWEVYAVGADSANGGYIKSSNGPLNFTTVTPPTAPTALTISNVRLDSMLITWTDNATNEDSFYVYRKAGSVPSIGSPFTDRFLVVVGDTTPTTTHSYQDFGLSINTHYYYRVSAKNVQGESNFAGADSSTFAVMPDADTLSNAGYTTMLVKLAAPSLNPSVTEYAVRFFDNTASTTSWMGTGGALQGSEGWGTYTAFGGAAGKTATGLSAGHSYTVDVKARNQSNVETGFGGSASLSTTAPLNGDYTIGVAAFNKATGKNITFERRTRMIQIEVPVEDENKNVVDKQAPKSVKSTETEVAIKEIKKQQTKLIDVEQAYYVPMENGVEYTGSLYAPADKTEKGGGNKTGTYATITAAVSVLNTAFVSGPVRYLLTDATYPSETFPISITPVTGASGTSTITFRPQTGVTTTISGSSATSIFKLNGADYITLDGSNSGGTDRNLTITNTNVASSTAAIWLSSSGVGAGATNDVIKNCILATGSNALTTYGICLGGATVGSTGADNDNDTVKNNSITVASTGICATGTAAVSSGGNDNLSIQGNSISLVNTIVNIGIQVGNGLNCSVSQNTISDSTTASTQPVGISLETGFVSSSVTRNNIIRVTTSATGGYGGRGITVGTGTATSNLTIANNFVSGVNGSNYSSFTNSSSMGIGIGMISSSGTLTTTTGGVNIYDNSVNMYGAYSYATGCLTAALYVGSGATALDIRNNIFVNTMNNTNASGTASKNYTVYSAATNAAFTDINRNDYYVTGTQGVLAFLSSDQATLSAWRTATGKDAQSINADALLTSNSDLHVNTSGAVSPVSNAGTNLAAVTVDYDGDTRNASTPDIGADEFSYPVPQAFTLTSPSGSGAQVAGNLSWSTSTNALKYDVYFFTDSANLYSHLVSDNQLGTTYGYSGTSATTYWWDVYAQNADSANGGYIKSGNGPFSFTTVTPPNAPTGLALSNVKSDSITLTWTDNAANEDSFYIYRNVGSAPSVGSPFTNRIAVVAGDGASTTTHTFSDFGLSPNVVYYYRVSAMNAQGESNYSENNTVTLAVTPAAPSLSNASIGNFTVTLNPSTNSASTQFAVRVVYSATTKYVHTSGVLVDTAVWGTYVSFGSASGKVVTGLNGATSYNVDSKARNNSLIETGYSATANISTLSTSYPVSESFDAVTFPPTGWAVQNVNADANTWVRGTTTPHSGLGQAQYTYNTLNAANDWLFTSPLTMQTGKIYRITYWYRVISASFPENFSVSVGTAQNDASMGTAIKSYTNLVNTTFIADSADYLATSNGTFYAGFKCFSAPDEDVLYLDDISIKVLPANDISAASVDAPALHSTKLKGVTFGTTGSFKGSGTVTQTNVPVTLAIKDSVTNATVFTSSKTIASIAFGATVQVQFDSANLNTAKDYYAIIYAQNPGDESASNDSTRVVFSVRVDQDVAAFSLDNPAPGASKAANTLFKPKASFKNVGVSNQKNITSAFPVRYEILNGSNAVVYADTQTIGSLASTAIAQVTFDSVGNVSGTTSLAIGTYTTRAISMLATDQLTTNDTVTGSVILRGALAGTYTVGATGNYPTITSVLTDLTSIGMNAPVSLVLKSDYSSSGETFPITISGYTGLGGNSKVVTNEMIPPARSGDKQKGESEFAVSKTGKEIGKITTTPVKGIPGLGSINEFKTINTLTVKPDAGAVVTITGSSTSSIIKLNGASYVTIDGSNSGGTDRSLTVSNTNTGTSSATIQLSTPDANTGVKNCTIKNVNVFGADSATTLAAISGGGLTVGSFALARNINNRIENNFIARSQYAILVGGTSTVALDSNLQIVNNSIGGSTTYAMQSEGVRVLRQEWATISGNDVQNVAGPSLSNTSGIDLVDTRFSLVLSNKIHKMSYNGTSTIKTFAMTSANTTFNSSLSPSSNAFVNNLIYDVVSTAVSSVWNISAVNNNGGYGDMYYFNSVNLTGQMNNTGTGPSAAFSNGNSSISTAGTNLDLRNNIWMMNGNSNGGAKVYSVYWNLASATGSTLDYNDLFSASPSGGVPVLGFFNSADRADLAAWQTATGQSAHGISVNPSYVSNSDLHIQTSSASVESRGTPINGITADYEGNTRNANFPDLGADEYTGPTVGAFTLTSPADNAINQAISGTFTWAASTNAVAYDVLLDQNNPPTTVVSSNQSGTSYNYSGLTKGFNYFWKVVAKNGSGTSSAGPRKFSTYTTPQSFTFVYPPSNAVSIPNHGSLIWHPSKDILKNAGVTYNVFLNGANPPTTQIGTNVPDTTVAYSGLAASTKYYWKVVANNDLGTISSVVDSFKSEDPVQAFNLLFPTDNSLNVPLSAHLNWSRSANATAYDVYYSTNPTPDSLVAADVTDTVFFYSGLMPTSVYKWKVVAKNSVSTLAAANSPFTFTTVTPPNAPSNLVIINVTTDSMDLTWTDNATNEDGFHVLRSLTGVEGTYVEIDSVGANVGTGTVTYTGSGSRTLGLNKRYFWRVHSFNAQGSSNDASANKATLAATPTAMTVNNPTQTTMHVRIASADNNPAVTEYAIRATGGLYVQNDTTLGATAVWRTRAAWGGISGITVKGLTSSTTYTFDAKARNLDVVETPFGPGASGTTKPTSPANASIDNITSTSMRLNWTDNTPDETGFYIYRTLSVESGYQLVDSVVAGSGGTISYNGTGLSVNTRYFWGISAYNVNGESPVVYVDATTNANTPGAPTLSSPSFARIRVLLNGANNPAGTQFAIRVQFNSTTKYVNTSYVLVDTAVWATLASFGADTGKFITGLNPGTQYTVDAKARNIQNVETPFSASASLSTNATVYPVVEGFEGTTFPPQDWLLQDVNGGTTWTRSTSYPHTGTASALYLYSITLPGNDWIYTLPLMMEQGKQYKVTYWYKASSSSFPERLKVMMGTAQNAASMTTLLADHPNITSTTYASNSVTITPSANGTYYIGFLAYSLADEFDLALDDVMIELIPGNDIAGQSVDNPTAVGKVAGEVFTPTATFRNNGLDPQSNVDVKFRILDNTNNEIYTSSKSISSLAINATAQVLFDQTSVNTNGTYSAQAIAMNTGDISHANDTVKLNFAVVGETRTNLTPDNGGYIFSASSSTANPRPTYGWEPTDLAHGGTLRATGDDNFKTVVLPRSFKFYDVDYQAINISTNGWISFDTTTVITPAVSRAPLVIPSVAVPNYLVSALWADLNSSGASGSGVYTKTVNNKYYIEWYKYQRFSVGALDTMNFEIVLDFTDNSIAISYASPSDGNFINGGTAYSIGVESDGNAGSGQSYYFTNTPPLNLPIPGTTIKFGTTVDQLNNTASISGYRYLDANTNGVKDVGELPLAGWQINANGPANLSATTDTAGYYEIPLMPAGSYNMSVTSQPGWVETQPASGSYTVLLNGSQAKANVNFGGYRLIAEIHGTTWNDVNGNGLKEVGEPGLANWEIHLSDAGTGKIGHVKSLTQKTTKTAALEEGGFTFGKKGASIVSAIPKVNSHGQLLTDLVAYTDSVGNYSFIDLPNGNYLLSEVPQQNWLQTYPATPGIWEVALDSFGRKVQNINFGNFHTGSVSGTLYLDLDASGSLNNGETGLQGWTIKLEKDGELVDSKLTDANGNYSFTDIGTGTYVISEVAQDGWNISEPLTTTYSIAIQSGTDYTAKNFGNYHAGSISGVVFEDLNANGTRDNGEPAHNGFAVNAVRNAVVSTTHSDANGVYQFANLQPGSYAVSESIPSPYILAQPVSNLYTIVMVGDGVSDDHLNNNFANYRLVNVSGNDYFDANSNGVKDNGEAGQEGWSIVLHSTAVSDTMVTDANGDYAFTNVLPGSYTLSQIVPLGYISTTPQTGKYSLTLNSGSDATGKDFGNRTTTHGEFVGREDSLWSNPNNWGFGVLPGVNDTVVIPAGVRVVLDGLGGNDSIPALSVLGTLRVSGNITLKVAASVSGSGTIDVDANATPLFNDYGSWSVDNFTYGMSTVRMSGDNAKTLSSGSFWKLEVEGNNTYFSGNVNIYKWLVADNNVSSDEGDTISINDATLNALRGNGVFSAGTIIRIIAPDETGNYQFQGPNTYIGFPSGKTGSNPASLMVTKHNTDSISSGTYLAYKGGTVDTLHNSVSVTGITHFSRWTFGQSGYKTGTGGECYDVEGASELKHATGFSATVSLEYDPAKLNVPESGVGLLKTANAVVVKNVIDADLDVNTTNDETAKKWYLTAGSLTSNDTVVTLDDVGNGTFVTMEADSALPFIHIGKTKDGVTSADTTTSDTVSFSGAEGTLHTIVYINAIKNLTKYRTFIPDVAMSVKTASIKIKKFTLPVPTPNLGNLRDSVLAKNLKAGGQYGILVGVPRIDSAKKYAWIKAKKGADLQKFFVSPLPANTVVSHPLDSVRSKAKHTALVKEQKFDRKIVGTPLIMEQAMLWFNITSSSWKYTPNGFGTLLYNETPSFPRFAGFKGRAIVDIARIIDSILTFYKTSGFSSSQDSTSLYDSLATFIHRINNSFYSTSTLDTNDLFKVRVIDTLKPSKNKLYVFLEAQGVKELYKVPYLAQGTTKDVPQLWMQQNTGSIVPENFALDQNYPNPFNPATTINFSLNEDAMVTLKVYDVLGREVATLLNNEQYAADDYSMNFDASRLTSGVYFYRLEVTSQETGVRFAQTRKMMLLK